jgi:hypothetical protein
MNLAAQLYRDCKKMKAHVTFGPTLVPVIDMYSASGIIPSAHKTADWLNGSATDFLSVAASLGFI